MAGAGGSLVWGKNGGEISGGGFWDTSGRRGAFFSSGTGEGYNVGFGVFAGAVWGGPLEGFTTNTNYNVGLGVTTMWNSTGDLVGVTAGVGPGLGYSETGSTTASYCSSGCTYAFP
jgi:hypothetical protein